MKAVLFDLDGVLVDTEPLKARAHVETVEALGGEVLAADLYRNVIGSSGTVVREYFMDEGNIDVEHPVYKQHWHQRYEELLQTSDPTHPQTRNLLARLLNDHYRLGLVTSSHADTVDIIARQARWIEHFDVVISGSDVEYHKPHPEPYLRTLRRLGTSLRQSVAVEDSSAGLISARRAGLSTVAVRHEYNRGTAFSEVAYVMDGLSGPKGWQLIQNLRPMP